MTTYFRNLIVWQKAFLLSQKIYRITQTFPDYEKFALADQMRRASVSIASNIAE
jgi:four helix bundle protein